MIDMHQTRNRHALKLEIAMGTYDPHGKKLDVAAGRLIDALGLAPEHQCLAGLDFDEHALDAERKAAGGAL